jgi:hypothetical protein
MLIFDKPSLAFIHIPKSGGDSMTSALAQAAARHGWTPHPAVLAKHDGAQALTNAVAADWLAGAVVLAIVRNPWARLASLHDFRLQRAEQRLAKRAAGIATKSDLDTDVAIVEEMRALGFCRWLTSTRLHEETYGVPLTRKPQLSWCRDAQGAFLATEVLRLESMDAGLLERLGIGRFPHVHRTEAPARYQDRYDAQAIDFVRRHFAEDIEFGRYRFESERPVP